MHRVLHIGKLHGTRRPRTFERGRKILTLAHWTTSGWHGWVYDWKLHSVTTVAAVWIPLAVDLTAATVADSELAPDLICRLPAEVRYMLGDRHDNTPSLRALCR